MSKQKSKQISISVDTSEYERMCKIRDETGMSIPRQYSLKIKGYKIVKE